MRNFLILAICIGLGFLAGCGKQEPAKSEKSVSVVEVTKEAKEAAKTAMAYTDQQMDEY